MNPREQRLPPRSGNSERVEIWGIVCDYFGWDRAVFEEGETKQRLLVRA